MGLVYKGNTHKEDGAVLVKLIVRRRNHEKLQLATTNKCGW